MDTRHNIPDTVLLQLITTGNEKAYNQLFERYRNRIYSYLVKVTKSKENAEELTLDIFLKIWTARSVLTEIDHFEAFLFRVVHNKAVDYLRMAQRSKLLQQELWKDMQTLQTIEPMADAPLLKKDTEAKINSIIAKLSPQRQEVFRLSREHFLTYDQIAERMNISRLTVRNHLSAALHFIRGNLDKGTEMATLIILTSRNF